MNTIKGGSEINRARPKRVFDTAHHMSGQVWAPAQHLGGWRPIRPFPLRRDCVDAGPGEANPAHPNPVPERLAGRSHKVKPPPRGGDDDGARPVLRWKIHQGTRNWR